MDEVSSAVLHGKALLLEDWRTLGNARDIGPVWPAFWRVFWATLSEVQESAPAAMPQQVMPRAKPIATAAHPRAFRGTKFQPPKPAQIDLDLHVWMSDDRLLDGFFSRHDFVRRPALGQDGQALPSSLFENGQPTVSQLTGLQGWSGSTPVVFRRHFLWVLRKESAEKSLAWLRLWRALGAPSHGELLSILARLCALDSAAHGWAELSLNLPKPRQAAFLQYLLQHKAYRLPASQLSAEQLSAVNTLSKDDAHFRIYLDTMLDNLSRGVSAAYTLIGCQLPARDRNPDSIYLRVAVHADEVPVADIERMLATLGEDGMHWARSAWKSCATQPGFARVLTETHWEVLSSQEANRWLSLFTVTEWDFDNPELFAAQWRVRLAMFPALHQQMLALPPDRRDRFAAMQVDYVCGWDDPATLESSWPIVLPLQVRLCGPRFPAKATGNGALSSMAVHLRGARLHQFAETGDDIWLTIERACRRDNVATLIRHGLYGLTEAMPDFALHALRFAPKPLMQSVALIGCLEYHSRRRFFAQAARTPWFATEWAAMPALATCKSILALCAEYGLDSPLPRRLRAHLMGTAHLNEAQLARHCRVTIARLPSVQLAALEAMAWRQIDGPFNLRDHSTAASHAVRLHASIDGGNKKALRRFLQGYADGGIHAYLDHPLNREWYVRHQRVDAAIWSTNKLHESTENGAIKLAIETDPLEILMLGSYVGSCLGLGGVCQYSSVACLVDANKQVVYARDASGRVVARQLIAIDERERLVCFEVYPQSVSAQVLQAFRRFDTALARSLGLDIYRDDDEAYEVKTILAVEWWDDGQWHAVN
ncbi:hypothetical protein [Duganella sp. Root198D2]|uniref:hypothetical protein n=1 Tax=Duganella sp. Root198D2 TaxID=1736489 RepID=UPI0012E3B215|nr:hypothetical protein [Duganella sp. Root198D2]